MSMKRTTAILIASLLAASAAGSASTPQQAPPASPDEAIAREYFSDLPLLTHEGREVRFFSDVLKDRVVLISSFYTGCEGITPRQNQVLLRLQEMLGAYQTQHAQNLTSLAELSKAHDELSAEMIRDLGLGSGEGLGQGASSSPGQRWSSHYHPCPLPQALSQKSTLAVGLAPILHPHQRAGVARAIVR